MWVQLNPARRRGSEKHSDLPEVRQPESREPAALRTPPGLSPGRPAAPQDTFPGAKPPPLQAPRKHRRAPRETLLRKSKERNTRSKLAEAGPACESRTPEYAGLSWLRGRPGGRGPSNGQSSVRARGPWVRGQAGSATNSHQRRTSHFLSHALTVWSGRRAKGLGLLLPTGLGVGVGAPGNQGRGVRRLQTRALGGPGRGCCVQPPGDRGGQGGGGRRGAGPGAYPGRGGRSAPGAATIKAAPTPPERITRTAIHRSSVVSLQPSSWRT